MLIADVTINTRQQEIHDLIHYLRSGLRQGQLETELAIARELIAARTRAGLSQAEVAARMGTSQATIVRLESGGTLPSLRTLGRYARATGSRALVRLVPQR
jgi:DNA-binding XRE family transcriptional regulator